MEYKYKAFISYNHNERDSRVARLLHNRIETYTVPRKLRKNGKKKPGKVFRDQEELSASSDLNQHIRDALDESEFLIVICSPGAVASKWVSKEIAYFLEHHKQEKLLTVLTDGDERELFPALFPGLPEPLSLDMRRNGDLKTRFLKLCAPLLGCEYDELVMRDQKRRRRQMMWWMAGIAAVAAAIISILLWSNWRIEGKNQELDQKNEELDQKNEELEQQNQELLLRESEILTQEALEALESGDRLTAIRYALDALPDGQGERPYYQPAEQTILSALRLFDENAKNYLFDTTTLEQSTAIGDFCISKDGKRLVTVDQFTTVNGFDTETGELLWSRQIQTDMRHENPTLLVCEPWDSVIYCNGNALVCMSQSTGEILWSNTEYSYLSSYLVFREEQMVLAVMTSSMSADFRSYTYSLIEFSTEDGSIVGNTNIVKGKTILDMDSELPEISFPINLPDIQETTFFSNHERYMLGCYAYANKGEEYGIQLFLVDFDQKYCKKLAELPCEEKTNVYHICIDPDGQELLCIRRDDSYRSDILFEKYSTDGYSRISQTVIAESDEETIHCYCQSSGVLIGTGSSLFRVDRKGGQVRYQEDFGSEILDLVFPESGEYGCLLANGEYIPGYYNNSGFWSASFLTGDHYYFGESAAGALWKDGGLGMNLEGYSYTGIGTAEDPDEVGYCVAIPAENNQTIEIHRPSQIPAILQKETMQLPAFASIYRAQQCGDLVVLYNMDTMDRENAGSVLLIDLKTMTVKGEFEQKEAVTIDTEVLFLPDGSGYLDGDHHEVNFTDLKNGRTTAVWRWGRMDFCTEDGLRETDSYDCTFVRLSGSGDILTAAYSELGIRLFLNDKYFKDVPYPEDFPEMSPMDDLIVGMGATGYAMVCVESKEGISDYWIYDYHGDAWSRIQKDPGCTRISYVLIGGEDPVLIVMGDQNMIWTYDIPTGQCRNQFRLGFSTSAIYKKALCMNDRYLTITTHDDYIRIVDIQNGTMVFDEPYENLTYFNLTCSVDQQGKYLFLFSDHVYEEGMMISTDTWEILAVFPNMLMYDQTQNAVLQHSDLNVGELTRTTIPDTAELVKTIRSFFSN